ncbi:MAG: CYTH domain-containing protein [Oscillospiraceae bacterium]|nr:CYTH domain-containing protein [Oscillospiraceae bacterium]
MGTELEWKYALPDPALLDEIAACETVRGRTVESPRRCHMQSEYYDTPDHRFFRERTTLRHRLEDESSVFCMKAPLRGEQSVGTALCRPSPEADPHLRGEQSVGTALCRPSPAADPHLRSEWETEAADLASALPRLAALGAPVPPADTPLQVLCRADFIRRAVLLRLDDGSTAELALDLGTLSGATRSLPLCELELELKSGEPAAARAFAEALAARFSLRPEPLSKFARASALK